MDDPLSFVVFALEGQRFAVPLSVVERVVPAGAIRRLRDVPDPLIGVIDLAGAVTPVLDVRTEGSRTREIAVDDLFLIVRDGQRHAVVVVDEVEGVLGAVAARVHPLEPQARHDGGPSATWQRVDDLVFIHDIDSLLTGAVTASVRAAVDSQG